MEYVKIEGQFPKFSHCAVTLGKFDGIHRGHRKLIQTILNRKKEYGELAVVMAFVSDRQTILQKNVVYFWKKWAWTYCWNVL